MAKVTVLAQSEAQVPGPEGKPQTYTYVTYRDEYGHIGHLTLPKKDPTDADIAAAILKQRREEAARKPREIRI